MSIEERLALVEERLADILIKCNRLIDTNEALELKFHSLEAEIDQYKAEAALKINLLCAMLDLPPNQLTSAFDPLGHPDLLRKRLDNQQN